MIYVLHDDDADGFGSCFAAQLKFGPDATYIPVNRGDPPPTMPDASEIFILDFSYSRAVMESLAHGAKITLIDHHASAQEELAGLPYCHFDTSKSAAVLSWEYFQPEQPVPLFFKYIQGADLWAWQLPHSQEIHCAVESHPLDFQTWKNISGISAPTRCFELEMECINNLIREGEICLRYADQQIQQMLDSANQAVFVMGDPAYVSFDPDEAQQGEDRYTVPVINASVLKSEACNQLLERNPDAKFAAYYHDMPHNRRQWGLRSRDGFDVSQIAKRFSGGGHPKSAGFQTAHDPNQGIPAKQSPTTAQ